MKVFIQKYYNDKGEERWQVVSERIVKGTSTNLVNVIEDDILTEEAAEKIAKFHIDLVEGRRL
jgi:hypothetical protein